MTEGDADIERWLAAAQADAERRGLPELKPLLDGLATSTAALRAAAWNDVADGPAPRHATTASAGAAAPPPAPTREDGV